MGTKSKLVNSRIHSRSYLTNVLVHLTKDSETDKAIDVLIKIIRDGYLKASSQGFIIGGEKVVCFQEVPLNSIKENLSYEEEKLKGKKRYSKFGIAISREDIYLNEGRPVIYETLNSIKDNIDKSEQWRCVNFDLNNEENYIDFTFEREWRLRRDIEILFKYDKIIIGNEDDKDYIINQLKNDELDYKELKFEFLDNL